MHTTSIYMQLNDIQMTCMKCSDIGFFMLAFRNPKTHGQEKIRVTFLNSWSNDIVSSGLKLGCSVLDDNNNNTIVTWVCLKTFNKKLVS